MIIERLLLFSFLSFFKWILTSNGQPRCWCSIIATKNVSGLCHTWECNCKLGLQIDFMGCELINGQIDFRFVLSHQPSTAGCTRQVPCQLVHNKKLWMKIADKLQAQHIRPPTPSHRHPLPHLGRCLRFNNIFTTVRNVQRSWNFYGGESLKLVKSLPKETINPDTT